MKAALIVVGIVMNIGASLLLDLSWHPPRSLIVEDEWGHSHRDTEAWGHSDYGFTAWTCRATGIALIAAAMLGTREITR